MSGTNETSELEEDYSFANDEISADQTYEQDDSLADLSNAGVDSADVSALAGPAISTPNDSHVEDVELEAIKARVKEMEEEAEKLKEMQNEVEKQMNLSSNSIKSPLSMSMEEKMEIDVRSVYVGNVDYGATAEELESHFHGCGSINRVTILTDKFSGHPKGFAYIEFNDKDSVSTAMALDDSLFRGRQIKVNPKRTNRPGMCMTDRPPRYMFRGRGRGRFTRSRGRFRPRRNAFYSPY